MKIKIITCGDYLCPSTRIRGYYVADYLRKAGYYSDVYPYTNVSGSFINGLRNATADFLTKFKATTMDDEQSIVFIQKCVNPIPYSTLLFELILKIFFRKKIIYDVDDALINSFNLDMAQKISDVVIVGGHALLDYSKKLNKQTFLIPTCFKEENMRNSAKKNDDGNMVVGFLGSPSTTSYLELLFRPLLKLATKYDYILRVVSAKNIDAYAQFKFLSKFKENRINLDLIPYSVETERAILSDFDIGLAPLYPGIWEKYKCGYKVINYMGGGVPPVATDYGEQSLIIKDGFNGFLCKDEEQWVHKLGILFEDDALRKNMAENGKKTVEMKYTFKNYDKLIFILNRL